MMIAEEKTSKKNKKRKIELLLLEQNQMLTHPYLHYLLHKYSTLILNWDTQQLLNYDLYKSTFKREDPF